MTPKHTVQRVSYEMDPGARVVALYVTSAGALVGYCELAGWEEPALWLGRLWVAEDSRRRGVATALVLRALDEARRAGKEALSLNVRPDAEGAVALYRKVGMHVVCRVEEDPLLMMTVRV